MLDTLELTEYDSPEFETVEDAVRDATASHMREAFQDNLGWFLPSNPDKYPIPPNVVIAPKKEPVIKVEEIKFMQSALRKNWASNVTIDGKIGPITIAAAQKAAKYIISDAVPDSPYVYQNDAQGKAIEKVAYGEGSGPSNSLAATIAYNARILGNAFLRYKAPTSPKPAPRPTSPYVASETTAPVSKPAVPASKPTASFTVPRFKKAGMGIGTWGLILGAVGLGYMLLRKKDGDRDDRYDNLRDLG